MPMLGRTGGDGRSHGDMCRGRRESVWVYSRTQVHYLEARQDRQDRQDRRASGGGGAREALWCLAWEGKGMGRLSLSQRAEGASAVWNMAGAGRGPVRVPAGQLIAPSDCSRRNSTMPPPPQPHRRPFQRRL